MKKFAYAVVALLIVSLAVSTTVLAVKVSKKNGGWVDVQSVSYNGNIVRSTFSVVQIGTTDITRVQYHASDVTKRTNLGQNNVVIASNKSNVPNNSNLVWYRVQTLTIHWTENNIPASDAIDLASAAFPGAAIGHNVSQMLINIRSYLTNNHSMSSNEATSHIVDTLPQIWRNEYTLTTFALELNIISIRHIASNHIKLRQHDGTIQEIMSPNISINHFTN